MMETDLKLGRIFFHENFINSVSTRNRHRLNIISRHYAIISRKRGNFLLTHLNKNQNINFFNTNIELVPHFISDKDIFNQEIPQYITSPGIDFPGLIDEKQVEIFMATDLNLNTFGLNYFKNNYQKILQTTEKISTNQGVLVFDRQINTFSSPKFFTFKNYKKPNDA